jgi:DNA-binding MarR family transcriptional regulator
MTEERQQLLQTYVRSLHRFMRLMGSQVLCTDGQPKIPKSQLVVLYVLLEDKKLSVKDIATNLSISSSAATQLVEHLVQTGLVERAEDSNDRRAVYVQLTAEGVRATVDYQQKLLKRLDAVLAGTSDEALVEIIEFQDNVVTKEQE